METPAGPLPVLRVAETRGGLEDRSTTAILLPGTSLDGSAGSCRWLAVTSAKRWSGEIATEEGGPTTLAGTWISALTRGGLADRSMMERVSGAGSRAVRTTPLSSTDLLSLAERAISARAAGGRNRSGAAESAKA